MSESRTHSQIKPRFSIVTVTFNDCVRLATTLTQTLKQTYEDFEIIVIDGGSTDNTVSVLTDLTACHSKIRFVSEPDSGIYDAMNKGIRLAAGEYTCFMNAGDTFFDDTVLQTVSNYIEKERADVVYGRTRYVYPCGFVKVEKSNQRSRFWQGDFFCHQSSFTLTSTLKEREFDTSFKIAADFDLVYSLHMANKKFLEIPVVVSNFAVDGISDKKRLRMIWEKFTVIKRFEPMFSWRLYYAFIAVKVPLFGTMKRVLPSTIVHLILLTKQRFLGNPASF